MRRLVIIQIIINCIFIVICLFFTLGKMLDVKYNIDSVSIADYGVCSDMLYSFIGQYDILIGATILINIIFSFHIIIKSKANN